jgi:mono/diheme cytochrome c family protein
MTTTTKLFAATTLLLSFGAFAGDLRGNAQAGKVVFTQNCVVCHGASGTGDGPAAAGLNPKPANFTDPARQRGMTEERQVHIVNAGGAAEKLSPLMPSFGDSLTDQQIKDVVAYVRDTFHSKEVSSVNAK